MCLFWPKAKKEKQSLCIITILNICQTFLKMISTLTIPLSSTGKKDKMLSMGKYDLSNIISVSLMCRHSKGRSSSEQKKVKN